MLVLNYALFAGDQYYPSGGMDDLVGRFETIDAAQKAARDGKYDWYQIVNVHSFKIVEDYFMGEHGSFH